MGIIYTIVNNTTHKIYVGQTWESLKIRWGRHQSKAMHGDTSCRHLYAALRKYGVDDFVIQVKAQADDQVQLDWLETYWIDALLATNRDFGYNLKSGGSAGRHTLETRKRMSRTRKAHPNSGTYRAGSTPWTAGRPRPIYVREKISRSKGGSGHIMSAAEKAANCRFRKTVAWG